MAEVVDYDAEKQIATIRRGMLFMKEIRLNSTVLASRHFETVITDLHDAQGNKN